MTISVIVAVLIGLIILMIALRSSTTKFEPKKSEYSSVNEVLEFYESTVFYPYGFVEALQDVENKLLDRIMELEDALRLQSS